MRHRLLRLLTGALLLAGAGCIPQPTAPAHAGAKGTACNQFVFIATVWDAAHRYWTYDYEVFDGVGNFCWQYNQRVRGIFPPPAGPMTPPPAPPNNRPHGALVTLYAGDFRAIQAHLTARGLPPTYTFDGSVLRGIDPADPIFNTRLSIGDVVVWDIFAHLVHTSGGPGGHDVAVWKADALADYLAGYLMPLPAHSGY